LSATLATALLRGQIADLLGGGQMVVATATVAGLARLLATAALGRWRSRAGGGRIIGWVVGLGFLAEQAVLEVADLSLEARDLVAELGLTLGSALVLGLVVASLLSSLAESAEQGAGLAGEGRAVGA